MAQNHESSHLPEGLAEQSAPSCLSCGQYAVGEGRAADAENRAQQKANCLTKSILRNAKRLFINRLCIMFILPALILLFLWCTWIEPNKILVRHEVINSAELSCAPIGKRIRILHISDPHVTSSDAMLRFQDAVEKAARFSPDLIFITGDLECPRQSSELMYFDSILAFLSHLAPTYACLGNHDYEEILDKNGAVASFRQRQEVIVALKSAGIKLLNNERTSAVINGVPITIAGIDDYWRLNFFPGKCLEKNTSDSRPLTLALLHNPEPINVMREYQWDVLFCGHSHGGQFRIPFTNFCPLAPMKDKSYAAKNLYRISDHKFMNVTSGVGNQAEFRFNCFPEIVIVDIMPISNTQQLKTANTEKTTHN